MATNTGEKVLGKVCFLIRMIRDKISEVTLEKGPEWSQEACQKDTGRRGIPDKRTGRTKVFLSVSVLGMLAGNSKESRGLELILGRGGCSRELGQRGSQRTLYPERSESWKLFNYIFSFSGRKNFFIILRCFYLEKMKKENLSSFLPSISKYSSLYVPSFYSFILSINIY